MTPKNLCGKRIKLVRTNREMAQADVCAAMEVDHDLRMSQNTLSNIERGTRILRDIELAILSTILEVSPLWLLFGDEQPDFTDTPFKGL